MAMNNDNEYYIPRDQNIAYFEEKPVAETKMKLVPNMQINWNHVKDIVSIQHIVDQTKLSKVHLHNTFYFNLFEQQKKALIDFPDDIIKKDYKYKVNNISLTTKKR